MLLVDVGHHTSWVSSIAVTRDGSTVISGSRDRSIRLWDTESGNYIRSLKAYLRGSQYGEVYHLNLSPNNRYLLMRGVLGGEYSDTHCNFRLYDVESGEHLFSFFTHFRATSAVDFSSDGNFLAIAYREGDVDVYRLSDLNSKKEPVICRDEDSYLRVSDEMDLEIFGTLPFDHIDADAFTVVEPYATIKAFDDPVKALTFFGKEEQLRLIALKEDGALIDWSLQSDSVERFKLGTGAVFLEDVEGKLLSLGPSDDQSESCISLFSSDFRLVDSLCIPVAPYELNPEKIALSPENNRIAVGANGEEVYLIDVKKGLGPVQLHEFGDNGLSAINWSDDETLVAAETESFDLLYYNIEKSLVTKRIAGNTRPIGAVGIKEASIGFGHQTIYYVNDRTPIERSFNLESLAEEKVDDSITYERLKPYNDEYSLGLIQDYRYDGLELRIENDDGSKVVARHTPMEFCPKIWTYGICPNGTIVAAGSSGTLDFSRIISDSKGHRFSHIGFSASHTGPVQALAASENLLAAAGKDHVVSLYRLDQFTKWISKSKDEGGVKSSATRIPEYEPTAWFLISDKGEYLLWTPDGYFTGSRSLSGSVGWQVNYGEGEPVRYYPLEQFSLTYNRPDIVLDRLGIVSNEALLAYRKLVEQRLAKYGLKPEQAEIELNAPRLSISGAVERECREDTIKLSFSAKDDHYKLTALHVFVNNVPIYGTAGKEIEAAEESYSDTVTVPLSRGENRVQISVVNEKGVESLRETVYVRRLGKVAAPDLYLLTIGVSDYKNDNYDLVYAAKDARDIASLYKSAAEDETDRHIFETVYHLDLSDSRAVKETILQSDTFFSKGDSDDYAMIFLAGHGIRDKSGRYYFGTHDMSFDDPDERGLAFDELDGLFENAPQLQRIIMMDTCFSGEANADTLPDRKTAEITSTERGLVIARKSGEADTEEDFESVQEQRGVLRDLFGELEYGTGAVLITSSSAREFSFESDVFKNGVFTYTILNGLKNKTADANGDGYVSASETLSWVREEVLELTHGHQTPTLSRHSFEFDYPLY